VLTLGGETHGNILSHRVPFFTHTLSASATNIFPLHFTRASRITARRLVNFFSRRMDLQGLRCMLLRIATGLSLVELFGLSQRTAMYPTNIWHWQSTRVRAGYRSNGNVQARLFCTGSQHRFEKLRIPILAEPIMRQIADLVIEAKLARRESVRLLEQAKARVEQHIEEAVQP